MPFLRLIFLFTLAFALCAQTPQPRSAAKRQQKAAAVAPAAQVNDDGYTKQILSATTDKQFLTELVDHLPASTTVPSPEKVLGYIAGASDKLTYAATIHAYMREVARTSPRVKVIEIGKTEEGREMIAVIVSDELNMARLDRLKAITAALADPRRTTDAEAEKLIAEGLPIYWTTGAIHSSETGSPEMLMELVYRLAVEETPFIQTIRKNMVVMVTPVIEVDGRERMVDLYRWRKANPDRQPPGLLYWGRYVGHDNNRDGMALSLALSRNVTSNFLEFHPQVLHDLHESVPFLYTSTGMGPYNAWLDPIVINEWQKLAWHEVDEMAKRGVPGVWTFGFYDGWGANYLMEAAHGHNSIGRFYETFGNGGADTRERTVPPAQSTRAWFRQSPPLPRVLWSHRNNVNLQQSALLLAMNYTATNKETFLRTFWTKSKRSVGKATTEGPSAYVISATERPNEAASLVSQLQMHGVEVHCLTAETEINKVNHPAGAYVIRMDQPYSRLADMLLDRQYYNPNDTAPYDDTGWTLTELRNLKNWRVTDPAILKSPMRKLDAPPAPAGSVVGEGPVYAVNHNADRALATFRFRLAGVKMDAAEASFESVGRKFGRGSFLIRASANPGDLRKQLEAAAADTGVTVQALGKDPGVATHPLAAPRIALVHTWQSTQTEGWFRLALESSAIPFSYISTHTLRDTADLRSQFDVLIFGPASGTSQSIVNGLPMRGQPLPWDASIGPNVAVSPDTTSDMRGGMGLEGLLNARRFVERGGLFVTVASNNALPIDFGLVEGVSISQPGNLKLRGSVVESVVADAASPVVYGYDERVPVYYNQTAIVDVSRGPGMMGGGTGQRGQSPASRPSGRGTASDPDVIQGRPYTPPPVPSTGPTPEMEEMMRFTQPAPEQQPRTILRFAEEKSLLISGMMSGGAELAGKPAVVSIPSGKGNFLMFCINPMWRQQTQGSYMLLLNAAMNFESLNTGRAPQPRPAQATQSADDFDAQQ
ncbi:MAG TPA: M14 family zinc carboxypeptidase [Bryobacteraceae bacterium]|nr:M14 family zinc carboxypeptidase [Bryobacteraceae bacterium]